MRSSLRRNGYHGPGTYTSRRGVEVPLVSLLAAMNTTDLVEQSYLRKGLPIFRPGDTVKVHARVVEAGQGAGAGVPGRRDPAFRRRPPRDVHGAEDLLRCGRRAHVPIAFPIDRQARDRAARSCPEGEALLPPGPPREEGADQGATDRRVEARRDGGDGRRGRSDRGSRRRRIHGGDRGGGDRR